MQVFVANPKKPPQIESILRRNKDKLLKFLKDFHNDKEGTVFLMRPVQIMSHKFVHILKTSNSWYAAVCQYTFCMAVANKPLPCSLVQDEKQFLIVQIQNL